MNVSLTQPLSYRPTAFAPQGSEAAPLAPTAEERAKLLEVAGNDDDGVKASGVIRKLTAGQFKGVADVRLRINFHEQLMQQAEADGLRQIESGAADLAGIISGFSDSPLAQSRVDETGQDRVAAFATDFDVSLAEAVSAATSNGKLDLNAFAAGARSALDEFTSALEKLSVASVADGDDAIGTDLPLTADGLLSEKTPVPELTAMDFAPDDADAPVESAATPQIAPIDSFQAAIAELKSAFEEALSALLTAAESTLQLPDPNPAPGQGRAYEKFLSMYDALRGQGDDLDLSA